MRARLNRITGGLSFDALTDDLDLLPLTTRAELQQDQESHPPYGTNLSFPLDRFCHIRAHELSHTVIDRGDQLGARPLHDGLEVLC